MRKLSERAEANFCSRPSGRRAGDHAASALLPQEDGFQALTVIAMDTKHKRNTTFNWDTHGICMYLYIGRDDDHGWH